MLDTAYSVETPEGIDLILRPAGPVARLLAYGIDTFIRWGVLLAATMLFSLAGDLGMGMLLILYFLLEWFYPVVFEVYRQGMTPGKKTMKLRVINDDNTPVGWSSSLIRNLLRFADFLPIAYVFGLLSMMTSSHFKRLGDLAAGTLVVYIQEPYQHNPTNQQSNRPLPVPLTRDEQRALLDFSECRHRLSPHRQQELADILQPLTGCNGEQGVEELDKMANSLLGNE
jgi:uncharacterized RDD family membrane protein YckC